MDNRKLKVYYAHESRQDTTSIYAGRTTEIRVPQIRLQGIWLERLGFKPGTQLDVKCEDGKLTITAVTH